MKSCCGPPDRPLRSAATTPGYRCLPSCSLSFRGYLSLVGRRNNHGTSFDGLRGTSVIDLNNFHFGFERRKTQCIRRDKAFAASVQLKKNKKKKKKSREVLQNEFRYDFRKSPREISAGMVFTVFTCIIAFNTAITVPAEISRGPFRKSYQNSFCKTSLLCTMFHGASEQLCEVLAAATRRLCTSFVDPTIIPLSLLAV